MGVLNAGSSRLGSGTGFRTDPFNGVPIGPVAHLDFFSRNGNLYQAVNVDASHSLTVKRGFDRFEVRSGDHIAVDSQYTERSEANNGVRRTYGADNWLSMATRHSQSAPSYSGPDGNYGWVITGQWWNGAEAGDIPLGPIVAFVFQYGRFEIRTTHDWTDPSTVKPPSVARYTDNNFQYDVWNNWVMRLRPEKTSNGEIQIWRNGTEVFNGSVPVGYNNTLGPRWEFGVYRGEDPSTQVCDYANVEISAVTLFDRVANPLPVRTSPPWPA